MMTLLASELARSGVEVSGDVIPGQVPSARVIHADVEAGRSLRGDFEVGAAVVLVVSRSWPRATVEIAGQVLDSGGQLELVFELDAGHASLPAALERLRSEHGDRVALHDERIETPWVRDWGPLQLREAGASLWLDAEHGQRLHDDRAPQWLARHHEVGLRALAWGLDGGAYVSNGAGLCVLTLDYLELRGLRDDEQGLREMLGQLGCRVSALVPTIVAEHTKHADMVAQFVAPERVMIAEIVDELGGGSEDALRLREAERGIRRAARALGLELDVVRVPTPPSVPSQNPRTYVNGLRLGDRYLMPSYPALGLGWERAARAAVEHALGEVSVVSIDASEMIGAGGAIHCASLGLFVD